MNYSIYSVLVVVMFYRFGYSLESPRDERWELIDWHTGFQQQLYEYRNKLWIDALVKLHGNAKQHKPCDISVLFTLPTRGVDLVAVLAGVKTHCEDLKIKLIDSTTQDVSTFLWWILYSITNDAYYKKLDSNAIAALLLCIRSHAPDIAFCNKEVNMNIMGCVGRIVDKELCTTVKYILRQGKMPQSIKK